MSSQYLKIPSAVRRFSGVMIPTYSTVGLNTKPAQHLREAYSIDKFRMTFTHNLLPPSNPTSNAQQHVMNRSS